MTYKNQTPIFFDKETNCYRNIFDKKGMYENSFISQTTFNVLVHYHWVCYGKNYLQKNAPDQFKSEKYERENELTKIRLSEELNGCEWEGEPLLRYMKKPYLEKLFNIKLSIEERTNFNLLKGFYLVGTNGAGFNGIFDVKAVLLLPRIQKIMEEKQVEKWKRLRIKLLMA
ncbi:hypothetical protein [Lysinibacillus xylanilyticus]|uniref:Uncharacterized protein n=1 Tax=Lysinibacillus xylanilyticus TaxID=582475 RepID=A0ABV3W0F2_9BACI